VEEGGQRFSAATHAGLRDSVETFMVRFGSKQRRPLPTSNRYIVRLVMLCVMSGLAIFVLNRRAAVQRDVGSSVETALAPTAFEELADGVISTDVKGKPVAAPAEDPLEEAKPDPTAKPVVDHDLLGTVFDRTPGLPPRAYYHLVDLATRASPALLKQYARPENEISIAHLYSEPAKYRGELIYLQGRLRGLSRFDALEDEMLNPGNLKVLYQGDLFTHAAHPNPYIIVIPEIPPGMKLGKDISETVTFAGFYLKLWRYKTATNVDRAAPLLVGRLISSTPPLAARSLPPVGAYVAAGLVLVIGLVVLGIWWVGRNSASKAARDSDTPEELDVAHVEHDLADLEQTFEQDGGMPPDPERPPE
jgi:hypothetical protein